jgi:hypothetical protein
MYKKELLYNNPVFVFVLSPRAVSYRWQDEEVWVCPGLVLNMSRWQTEQVVSALGETSCFYVWIDRLSVPQQKSELQNTLLSRMMATYASSRETLVLRSLEEDGSRYHQRAWCANPLSLMLTWTDALAGFGRFNL